MTGSHSTGGVTDNYYDTGVIYPVYTGPVKVGWPSYDVIGPVWPSKKWPL